MFSGCITTEDSHNVQAKLTPMQLVIEEKCREYYLDHNLMSLSISVVIDGEVTYCNFGKTKVNGDEVDEHTLYEIGSLTKLFTGTLLADMVNTKLIDLNTPTQTYLDEKRVLLPKFEGKPIRIIDLATHTSGLPKLPVGFKNSTNPYADIDLDDLFSALNGQSLFREPGTKYQYSNYGYALLGSILCSVEKKSYDQILEDRIIKGLNLENTKVNLSKSERKLLALPHSITQRETDSWDFKAYEAAGGLKSSAKDMGNFLLAHLQSPEFPSFKRTIELTQRIYYDNEKKMGLAWHCNFLHGKILYEHTGETGGYMSYIAIVPDCNTGIYLVTNCKKNIRSLGEDILKIITTNQESPNNSNGGIR